MKPFEFTGETYHRLAEVGILHEDDPVELLEGRLVTMWRFSPRHAWTVALLNDLLHRRTRDQAMVWPRNPIVLDRRSEPHPDLALLVWRDDYYRAASPGPRDVLLVVEIGDASAAFDRDYKAPLYARAGIRELWLVDLEADVVTVCRKPGPDGLYSLVSRRRGGERMELEAVPGVEVTVEEVLGTRAE